MPEEKKQTEGKEKPQIGEKFSFNKVQSEMEKLYTVLQRIQTKPRFSELEEAIRQLAAQTQLVGRLEPIVWSQLLSRGSAGAARVLELDSEISAFRQKLRDQASELYAAKLRGKNLEKETENLRKTIEQLQQKEDLAFLLSRVSNSAQEKLLIDESFRNKFADTKDCEAFVISVDIRRSTELMLKARSPKMFAEFITTLCEDLECIIKENYGVFDKFTGDGVTAFFPDFYSGPDAGYFAIRSAQHSKQAFEARYLSFRHAFTTILKDAGLGIGIDYGRVHLLRMAGGFTVVGGPVVYACRLSGAPAGKIYLNQPAFEILASQYSNLCYTSETDLEIKHEGRILCYDVQLNKELASPRLPEWL